MRFVSLALVTAVSATLASAASAQVVNLGPVNGDVESITNNMPNDWFYGASGGGFINALAGSGRNGTGGLGMGSGSALPGNGVADLRSRAFSVADAVANTGKVDFSLDYNLLANFPASGFPIGDFLVQLRFFADEAGTQFRGESNTWIGTNHNANPGNWQTLLVDDFTVPAGATHADIRVSVNLFNSGNIVSANFDNFAVTTVVPEPASLSLLGLGSMALLRRRRD